MGGQNPTVGSNHGHFALSRSGDAGQVFSLFGVYEKPKESMIEKTQRMLIVDDHTLLRAGLRASLNQDPGIEIVGEVADGRDAVRAVG